jgi:hypothetical protein
LCVACAGAVGVDDLVPVFASGGTAVRCGRGGLIPRIRLKAVLSANALPYPTWRATESTVASEFARRSAAMSMRHAVR